MTRAFTQACCVVIVSSMACMRLANADDDGFAHQPGWWVAGPYVFPAPLNYDSNVFLGLFNRLPGEWHGSAPEIDLAVIPHEWQRLAGGLRPQNGGTNVVGQEVNGWRMRRSVAERPENVEFMPEHSLLLAQKTWLSPVAQPGELRLGSDDAVKAWYNGKHIFTYANERGYTVGRNVVPVELVAGSNTFMFVLVNSVGESSLGAEVFPAVEPLDGQLQFRVDQTYDTGNPWEPRDETMPLTEYSPTTDVISLDYYWLPAAGTNRAPQIVAWTNKPGCDWLRVCSSEQDGVVFRGTNIPGSAFPLTIDMRGKPPGVYTVEARWQSGARKIPFAYLAHAAKLTDTQRWWMHVMHERPMYLYDIFAGYKSDEECGTNFSGRTVRAFRSRIDKTLQPYRIRVPENLAGQTNCPLLVRFEGTYSQREDWSLEGLGCVREQGDWIEMTPYDRGGEPFDGLAELNAIEAIEEVCRVFTVDRTRIVLKGNCSAGEECWRIASHRPDRFAAIIPYGSFDTFLFKDSKLLNLRNVPVRHHQPELWHLEDASKAVTLLASIGADARISIMKGGTKRVFDQAELTNMTRWALTKRLDTSPTQVFFSTYGDVDGAYWVRNIMPLRFGSPALVEAEWNRASNATILVSTINVGSLALDLCRPIFTQCPMWQVSVDGVVVTNVASGAMWTYHPGTAMATRSTRGKRNGFCGGVADVVNSAFCMAYATGEDGEETLNRAMTFHRKLIGRGLGQINGNFPVLADTNLTAETCARYNAILFCLTNSPGGWLTQHADALPFKLHDGVVRVGGRTGWDMMCLYPNPLATNRYLLVVTSTNLTVRGLWTGHWDVLLDGVAGSFDANWGEVVWQEQGMRETGKVPASGEDNADSLGNGAARGEQAARGWHERLRQLKNMACWITIGATGVIVVWLNARRSGKQQ